LFAAWIAIVTGRNAVLQKLCALIADALERAAAADQQARDATDPQDRLDKGRLAKQWRELACSYHHDESRGRFLINVSNNRQLPPSEPPSDPAVPSFLFRCPVTGSGVQGFLIEEAPSDDPNSFNAVSCLDCGRIHLVNFRTGKTVGEARRDR
jgi:hypothetical protein